LGQTAKRVYPKEPYLGMVKIDGALGDIAHALRP